MVDLIVGGGLKNGDIITIRNVDVAGVASLTDLSDTPSSYSVGSALVSTASGTEWQVIDAMEVHGNEYHTDPFATVDELTSCSGFLQAQLTGGVSLHDNTYHSETYATETYVDGAIAGLTTDHGSLTGLLDDDHSQYFNEARGDARYYTKAQISSITDGLQSSIDTNASGIASNTSTISSNYIDLDDKIDTTSGTLNTTISNLETSLTTDILWETVDTPTDQVRLKSAHLTKALYHGGNMTLAGDLTVSGSLFTTHSEDVYVGDKLMWLNWGETGAGVSGDPLVGIEVDRGSELNYRFVFDEVSDTFKVGISGTLQKVATREDDPTSNYIAYWNSSEYRFDTASGIAYTDIATNSDLTTLSGALQDAIDNVDSLPDQTSHAGEFLTTNGSVASWSAISGNDLDSTPDSDHTGTGMTSDMTVDVNATGFGAALYVAADGHLEEADADSNTTMPCIGLALEAGTGTKSILLHGFIRDDTWSWTPGAKLFISTTAGGLTETIPNGSGDIQQVVGIAISADVVYFMPNFRTMEVE